MATMNISLPDSMKDWVEAQVNTGRYRNASDYVRDLIRRDLGRADKITQMQSLVSAGLESGVDEKTMADILILARKQAGTDTADGIEAYPQ